MSERERCPTCDRPVATNTDWRVVQPGEQLCWGGSQCQDNAIDWRRRYFAERKSDLTQRQPAPFDFAEEVELSTEDERVTRAFYRIEGWCWQPIETRREQVALELGVEWGLEIARRRARKNSAKAGGERVAEPERTASGAGAILPPVVASAPVSPPAAADPIPMILHCPDCCMRHVDKGDFATKPHHTHSCQACGLTWRPAVVPTVGVQFLPGFKDPPQFECPHDVVGGGNFHNDSDTICDLCGAVVLWKLVTA